jgi:hypothetical protein
VNKRIITVRTRAEPQPYAGGRVFHVYPHGTPNNVKIQPAFEGCSPPTTTARRAPDMTMADSRPRVRAGDTILVHAGLYKYKREHYTNTASLSRCRSTAPTISPAPAPPTSRSRSRRPARRGDLRRQRAINLFNVKGGRLPLLRGADLPQHRDCDLAGTQRIVGAKGLR